MDRYQQHVTYSTPVEPIPTAHVGLSTWEKFTAAQVVEGLIRHDHTPKPVEYLAPELKVPGDFGITAKPFRFMVDA